jgi:hypothetical protein
MGKNWSVGCRHRINEARDLAQPIVTNHAEIHSPCDRRSTLRGKRPREANALVVSIDRACARKLVVGKPHLDAFDHGINAAVSVTPHQGIHITCILRPDDSDEITPAFGILLIPHGNVAINELRNVVHL